MPPERPLTILCISSYEKGQEFLREAKKEGCRVLLLTLERLRNADWPSEAIDEFRGYLLTERGLAERSYRRNVLYARRPSYSGHNPRR